MKKYCLLILLAIFAAIPMMAQEKTGLTPEKRKEFRDFKFKFLAQEMKLSGETQKKFFEVYNQLCDERYDLRHEMKAINHKIKAKTATDADYTELNKLKDKEAEIEKKYDAKFATFLSAKEIYQLKEAEATFKQKVKEFKEKKKMEKNK
ncbi:MAG: hypothetical protein K2N05_06565 [Muribaculaceae bacterium]|nr:hypothetical protein [Muribaculaceae bacterium]